MGDELTDVKGPRLERRKDTPLVRVCPCWILNRVDPTAVVLWMELHSLEKYGTKATTSPGVRWLGETIGVAANTITRAIADLESIGAMTVWRRANKTSIYQTNYDDPSRSESEQQALSLDGRRNEEDTPDANCRKNCDRLSQKLGTNHIPSASSQSSDASAPPTHASEGEGGITTRELIGAFLDVWRLCGLGTYAVTGKDRAVLKEHLRDFSSIEAARDEMEGRVRWAIKKEFWGEHLCLRSVLETVANQQSLSRADTGKGVAGPESGGLVKAGSLLDQYKAIAAKSATDQDRKSGVSSEAAAALGLTSSASLADTNGSGKVTPVGTSHGYPPLRAVLEAVSDEPDQKLER